MFIGIKLIFWSRFGTTLDNSLVLLAIKRFHLFYQDGGFGWGCNDFSGEKAKTKCYQIKNMHKSKKDFALSIRTKTENIYLQINFHAHHSFSCLIEIIVTIEKKNWNAKNINVGVHESQYNLYTGTRVVHMWSVVRTAYQEYVSWAKCFDEFRVAKRSFSVLCIVEGHCAFCLILHFNI